jgi:hypothetical protein
VLPVVTLEDYSGSGDLQLFVGESCLAENRVCKALDETLVLFLGRLGLLEVLEHLLCDSRLCGDELGIVDVPD